MPLLVIFFALDSILTLVTGATDFAVAFAALAALAAVGCFFEARTQH